MPKPYPIELRERVVAHVEEGNSHRATAGHFRVSIKFVNDMVILKRETGLLAPRLNPGHTGPANFPSTRIGCVYASANDRISPLLSFAVN